MLLKSILAVVLLGIDDSDIGGRFKLGKSKFGSFKSGNFGMAIGFESEVPRFSSNVFPSGFIGEKF